MSWSNSKKTPPEVEGSARAGRAFSVAQAVSTTRGCRLEMAGNGEGEALS